MTENIKTYNANNITVLEGLEAVRKRPSMYIGSTGERGLHHLVYEVVDNSIDEAMVGECNEIIIIIHKDNQITVKDNGRGIPVDIHPKYKVSALELVMTKLHGGGKFDKKTYQISGGLHGVGVSVVNALSEFLEVTVEKDGLKYVQKYKRGIPQGPVENLGKTNGRGTTVIFKADTEIFSVLEYDSETLLNRLRELAFLNKGLKIIIEDQKMIRSRSSHMKEEYLAL